MHIKKIVNVINPLIRRSLFCIPEANYCNAGQGLAADPVLAAQFTSPMYQSCFLCESLKFLCLSSPQNRGKMQSLHRDEGNPLNAVLMDLPSARIEPLIKCRERVVNENGSLWVIPIPVPHSRYSALHFIEIVYTFIQVKL